MNSYLPLPFQPSQPILLPLKKWRINEPWKNISGHKPTNTVQGSKKSLWVPTLPQSHPFSKGKYCTYLTLICITTFNKTLGSFSQRFARCGTLNIINAQMVILAFPWQHRARRQAWSSGQAKFNLCGQSCPLFPWSCSHCVSPEVHDSFPIVAMGARFTQNHATHHSLSQWAWLQLCWHKQCSETSSSFSSKDAENPVAHPWVVTV